MDPLRYIDMQIEILKQLSRGDYSSINRCSDDNLRSVFLQIKETDQRTFEAALKNATDELDYEMRYAQEPDNSYDQGAGRNFGDRQASIQMRYDEIEEYKRNFYALVSGSPQVSRRSYSAYNTSPKITPRSSYNSPPSSSPNTAPSTSYSSSPNAAPNSSSDTTYNSSSSSCSSSYSSVDSSIFFLHLITWMMFIPLYIIAIIAFPFDYLGWPGLFGQKRGLNKL